MFFPKKNLTGLAMSLPVKTFARTMTIFHQSDAETCQVYKRYVNLSNSESNSSSE